MSYSSSGSIVKLADNIHRPNIIVDQEKEVGSKSTKRPLSDGSGRDVQSCFLSCKSVDDDDVAVGQKIGQTSDAGTAHDKDKLTDSHGHGVDCSAI